MKVRYVYSVEIELDEAIEYYNYQLPGLGMEFYKEVSNAIERIIHFPSAWTKIGRFTRRCLIKRFPYAILFSFDKNENEIIVLAIANLHRNPIHYKDRIR